MWLGGGGLLGEVDDRADRVLSVVTVIQERATKVGAHELDVLAEFLDGGVGGIKRSDGAGGLEAADLDGDAGQSDVFNYIGGAVLEFAFVAEINASEDAVQFVNVEGEVGGRGGHVVYWVRH